MYHCSSKSIVANTTALAHYRRAMEKMIKYTISMLKELEMKMFTVAHNQWLNKKSNYLRVLVVGLVHIPTLF